jgi:5-deoxy-glucuronate isomerase
MTQNELYVPKGASTNAQYAVDIDPKRAGWAHSSLRIVELAPGGTHTFTSGDSEWIVLPLEGGCTVHVGTEQFQLLGRESVFAGVSDFAYVPRDTQASIASGAGGRFALAGAKCERRLPARYGPAPEVPHGRPPAHRRHRMCLGRDPNGRHSVGRAARPGLVGWSCGRDRDPTVAGHGT